MAGRKRLLYLMRHPRDRIDSHIADSIWRGRATARTCKPDAVIGVSSYARQLVAYEQSGLLNDILLLDFADLCNQQVQLMQRVYDFPQISRVTPTQIVVRSACKIPSRLLTEANTEVYRENSAQTSSSLSSVSDSSPQNLEESCRKKTSSPFLEIARHTNSIFAQTHYLLNTT